MTRSPGLRQRGVAAWRGWAGTWSADLRTYPRNVYLLLLFTLGKGFQLSIGQVTTSLYAYSVGYRQDFVGLLIAVPALGALLAAAPVGFLADRIPRKPLLIVTGLLNPLALAAIGLTTRAPVMLVAGFINGVLSSAYWVTNIPMLTESVEPKRRVSVMSLNSFLLLGIGALGATLGGAVPEWVSGLTGLSATSPLPLRWGVLTAAIAVFVPTLALFWLDPTRMGQSSAGAPSGVEAPGAPGAEESAARGLTSAAESAPAHAGAGLARPIVLLFILLLVPDVLYTAGEGSVVALEPLYFRLRFHLSPGAIGLLIAAAGLLSGVTALLAPAIVRRFGKLRVIVGAQALSAPVALLIGYAPLVGVSAAAEFGRNFLRGMFEPVYATFAMERVSSRYRARLSGFYSITWSVGFSLGSAISGWLQRNVSLSAGFLLGAVLLLCAPIWLTLAFRRDPTVD